MKNPKNEELKLVSRGTSIIKIIIATRLQQLTQASVVLTTHPRKLNIDKEIN